MRTSLFAPRILTSMIAVSAGALALWFTAASGEEEPKDPSKETITVQKTTKLIAGGSIKQTKFSIPAANGDIEVEETSEENTAYIRQGKVGFRTMDEEDAEERKVWVQIRGPKNFYTYVDIDGDGRLDVVKSGEGSSILVGDRWVKVEEERTAPRQGSTMTSIGKPKTTYTFKKTEWVKK